MNRVQANAMPLSQDASGARRARGEGTPEQPQVDLAPVGCGAHPPGDDIGASQVEVAHLQWQELCGKSLSLVPPGRWVEVEEVEACGLLQRERAGLEEEVGRLRQELARLQGARGRECERLREEARADADRRLGLAIDGLADTLRRERVAMVAQAREACLRTVEALIGAHCMTHPDVLLAPLEDLLEARAQEPALCLRVAPSQRVALERRFAHNSALRIVEDPALAPGDALLEVPEGQYDCRVATLLAADASRTLPAQQAPSPAPEAA